MSYEMTDELKEKFIELAYERTEPFCYGCYRVVGDDADKRYAIQRLEHTPDDDTWTVKFDPEIHGYYCHKCGSDDLMRHLEGVGVEYGIEWVIESLIESECEAVDEEDTFDDFLDEVYPEVQFPWGGSYPASHVFKEMDEISYNCSKTEYFNNEVSEGYLIECNGSYYRPDCVEG